MMSIPAPRWPGSRSTSNKPQSVWRLRIHGQIHATVNIHVGFETSHESRCASAPLLRPVDRTENQRWANGLRVSLITIMKAAAAAECLDDEEEEKEEEEVN